MALGDVCYHFIIRLLLDMNVPNDYMYQPQHHDAYCRLQAPITAMSFLMQRHSPASQTHNNRWLWTMTNHRTSGQALAAGAQQQHVPAEQENPGHEHLHTQGQHELNALCSHNLNPTVSAAVTALPVHTRPWLCYSSLHVQCSSSYCSECQALGPLQYC